MARPTPPRWPKRSLLIVTSQHLDSCERAYENVDPNGPSFTMNLAALAEPTVTVAHACDTLHTPEMVVDSERAMRGLIESGRVVEYDLDTWTQQSALADAGLVRTIEDDEA